MGPLSSPGTTSYRLPIVTIGLSLAVFAELRMFQTDRRTDGIGLAIGGTKVHRPPESEVAQCMQRYRQQQQNAERRQVETPMTNVCHHYGRHQYS